MAGNLQAVLDEYLHILHGSTGVALKTVDDKALDLALFVRRALEMRASNLGLDELSVDVARSEISVEKRNLRARFAVRFADDPSDEAKQADRERQIRDSFNSPFWPFVLATTSVGQEGLDFHYYCHAVVHWNLPSNPVNLEQREGRVHRFKGHAIRKNIASAFAEKCVGRCDGDPWAQLFEQAVNNRADDVGDLVPYWLYPVEGGARIERHVPAIPLSRDLTRLIALRKTLAVYRMVFGQARQEDLVRFLLEHVGEERLPEVLNSLSLNLRP